MHVNVVSSCFKNSHQGSFKGKLRTLMTYPNNCCLSDLNQEAAKFWVDLLIDSHLDRSVSFITLLKNNHSLRSPKRWSEPCDRKFNFLIGSNTSALNLNWINMKTSTGGLLPHYCSYFCLIFVFTVCMLYFFFPWLRRNCSAIGKVNQERSEQTQRKHFWLKVFVFITAFHLDFICWQLFNSV